MCAYMDGCLCVYVCVCVCGDELSPVGQLVCVHACRIMCKLPCACVCMCACVLVCGQEFGNHLCGGLWTEKASPEAEGDIRCIGHEIQRLQCPYLK